MLKALKTRRTSYSSVIFYIISAWFMIFFFWHFIENNNYVSGIINAGNMTFRGNEFEIVGFYMNNCAPYLFYALVTGVLGWILMKMKHHRFSKVHETSVVNCDCGEDGREVTETIITRTESE